MAQHLSSKDVDPAPRLAIRGSREHVSTRIPAGPPVVVFDVGGTWFRAGLLAEDGHLVGLTRQPAINYLRDPGASVPDLQQALAHYLIETVARIADDAGEPAPVAVGISIGAPVDAHSGIVLGSGPLWGPDARPIDLIARLRRLDPEHAWVLINDVSAALLRCVADLSVDDDLTKLTLVTVSTGIAARTYDLADGEIPTDRLSGVQGEIGHLPVEFRFRGRVFDQACECGGLNHLNAFVSGRGMAATLARIAADEGLIEGSMLGRLGRGPGPAGAVGDLAEAVRAQDPLARAVLDAFTKPLADILLTHLALDPLVERVILTGGVVHAFGAAYLRSLIAHLMASGLYQISDRNPRVFDERFVLGPSDDRSGLIGAAIAARNAARDAGARASLNGHAWTVKATLPVEYRVEIVDDLLDPANEALVGGSGRWTGSARRLVIVDRRVHEAYADRLVRHLQEVCDEFALIPFDATETQKAPAAWIRLLRAFDDFELLRRSEPVIAVGGGVLLDMVGFAASVYRRGTPYIRVPTSLVAMVDAAVGVKTGLNFNGRKNRIGSYAPPLASFIDRAFLRTLPVRHLRSGMAEIVKVAIARDVRLFELVEEHGEQLLAGRFQSGPAEEVMRRAIEGMLAELQPNLWERTLERAVDLGHSFSPGLEVSSLGGLLHGEAVALDLALSTRIAQGRGLVRAEASDRILAVLRMLGLPVHDALMTTQQLMLCLGSTVLHRDGAQRLPLPVAVGRLTWVNDVTAEELECAAGSLARLR